VKTVLKIALGFVLLGLLASAGLVVALKILYPPERIKAIAVSQLVKSLGREIKLAEASIGLGGVSLEKLEVSEVPNFAAGTAATLKSLSLKVDLRPLLFKREFRVKELALDGLSVHIVADKDGSMNVAKGTGKSDSPEAGGAVAPVVSLERLSVSDGSLRYEDKASGTKASVSGLSLTASGAGLAEPFPLALKSAVTLDGKKGEIDFEGTLDPKGANIDAAGVAIDALVLVWEGKRYSLAGTLKPLSAPAGKLTVGLPALEAGGVSIPALSGTLHAAVKNGLIALTRLDLKGDEAALKGSVVQTKSRWTLSGLAASLGGISATLDGTYAEAGIDLRLRADELDLEKARRWVPALKEMNAAGTASVDLKAKGRTDSPALEGKLRLANAALNASGQALTGLNGRLSFTPETADAALKGALNGAAFDAQLAARGYRTNRPKIELTGTLAKLDLSKLPESSAAKDEAAPKQDGGKESPASLKTLVDAKGSLTIGAIVHPRFQASKTTMLWDLREIGSDLSSLDGTVSFSVGAGKFEDLKQLGASNGLVKVVLLPIMIIQKVAGLVKVPLFPNFDKVDFKEIVGDYSVQNGRMTVKKSHLDSSAAFVTMAGSADLGKEALNLKVDAKLSGALKAPIAFQITGTISDPKVKLDAASVLKQPEVNKALEQGKDLLKKQGEQLLKGLFGR